MHQAKSLEAATLLDTYDVQGSTVFIEEFGPAAGRWSARGVLGILIDEDVVMHVTHEYIDDSWRAICHALGEALSTGRGTAWLGKRQGHINVRRLVRGRLRVHMKGQQVQLTDEQVCKLLDAARHCFSELQRIHGRDCSRAREWRHDEVTARKVQRRLTLPPSAPKSMRRASEPSVADASRGQKKRPAST